MQPSNTQAREHGTRSPWPARGTETGAPNSGVSDSWLRAFFDNAQIGCGQARLRDGRAIHANHRMATMFGYPSAEAFVADFSAADRYVDAAARDGMMAQLAQTGIARNVEAEMVRKDGTPVWIRFEARLTPDGERIDLIAADITEFKRRELELAEQATVLNAILSNIDQGVSLFSSDLRLVASNDRCSELLEFPPSTFNVGDSLETIVRFNAQRGEYGPGDIEEQVRERVALARRFEPHCFERARPDGTVIEVRGRPLPEGGFVTTYTDVTALRRREQEVQAKTEVLRGTLDNMDQGLVAFDPDLKIICANLRAQELLDVTPDKLAVGADFADIIRDAAARGDYGPSPDQDPAEKNIRIARSGAVRDLERIRNDGTTLEIRQRPLPGGGVVVTYANVTERRRVEAELRRLNSELTAKSGELERSNAELEQFAYVASHDLQEPLRMVASYCQLLQKRYGDRLDGDANEFIAFAVDGATRMRRLINDLLAYSRVGSGAAPPARIDCQDVIDEVRENLGVLIEETGAQVLSDDLPTLLADRTLLVQLFQNLIGNALKFRGPARPVIRVGAVREAGHWRLSVADNGIGIEAEYADRIFLIFQRLHTVGQYPGTGIGLAVCKKIVEHHGGRIRVESGAGGGSTFHFTLPAED